MQFAAVDVDTEIKIGGNSTTVANNDFAKLAYYLSCVAGCIPGVIESRFTSYHDYQYFSNDTKAQIIVLCAILEPGLLEGRVFFLTSDAKMEALHAGRSNTFVTATQRQNLTMVNIDREGAVGLNLNNTEIVKVMIYKQQWMNSYYITPMKNINAMLRNEQRPQQTYVPITYQNSGNYYAASNDSNFCDGCSGYILVFLLSVFFSLLGLCCGMSSQSVKNKNWACVFGLLGVGLNAFLTLHFFYNNNDSDY